MPFLGGGLRGPKGDKGDTGESGTTTIAQVDDLLSRSFYRDFSTLKNLNDHGTGPAITFTRGSNATYFDANGTLQTASNDVARFDHSTDGAATSLGLLIEEARTNSIRNSQAGGSTNGVIGSGGALPTNWGNGANLTSNGVSLEVIGTGTESGLSYIDLKISGTPTASTAGSIRWENSTNQIAALNGQTWTLSNYIKLQAGSVANATVSLAVQGYDSTNNFISGQQTSVNITPTSSALNTQRRSVSHTHSSASTAFVFSFVAIAYTSGNPIDLTLRIAAPQLELGAFPTSYIPTTTAAATRAADSAVVTPISSFYNQAEGTLFAEGSRYQLVTNSKFVTLVSGSDTSRNIAIEASGATPQTDQKFLVADGVNQATITFGSASANTVYRVAAVYRVNDFHFSQNGTLGTPDTSGSIPSGITRLGIGNFAAAAGSTFPLNGHIRKVAYWPKRLTNTLLEQLTT